MPEISINLWAVLAAAVANMIIGALWYGPLFGKRWMALMGFTPDGMKNMPMTMAQAMVGGLVSSLIMAYILAHDAFVWHDFFGASVGPQAFALQLAFWIWLGYVATTLARQVLWEGKSWHLFILNASNSLVSLVVMAFILVQWP